MPSENETDMKVEDQISGNESFQIEEGMVLLSVTVTFWGSSMKNRLSSLLAGAAAAGAAAPVGTDFTPVSENRKCM